MPRKRDGAPVRGVNEIVEEITDNLRPWKSQSREAIDLAVRERMESLREMIPLQAKLMDRRRMRDHARDLDKALSAVEKLLMSDPGGLNLYLFSPLPLIKDEMSSKETIILA